MSIIIRDLSKSFWKGNTEFPILKKINLNMTEGEILALVGSSGSGKSTLLSIVAGLETPSSGSVAVFGRKLTDLNADSRARYRSEVISIVFQQFHLFPHLTALENVCVPLEIKGDFRTEAGKQLLAEVGLEDRLNNSPAQLSGGECQRVAIARALITAPKLILADEPSGSLDEQTGRQVMNLFFKSLRSRKQSAIIVTHNPSVAEMADRTLTLKMGELS